MWLIGVEASINRGCGWRCSLFVPTNRGYIAGSAILWVTRRTRGPLGSEIFCLQELQQTASEEPKDLANASIY